MIRCYYNVRALVPTDPICVLNIMYFDSIQHVFKDNIGCE